MLAIMIVAALAGTPAFAAEAGGDVSGDGQALVLVENGESLAPIIVSEGMPAEVVRSPGEFGVTPSEFRAQIRRAADELADYIEKISGARPEVIEGTPQPIPDRAIWVGYQPALDELFPDIDFAFEHPEEILIAASANHLVIAGRDRGPEKAGTTLGLFDHFKRDVVSAPNTEDGTANAVTTFLQKYLDVRWLWPGDLGEDIVQNRTIAFEPFVYRYHPPLRGRKFHFNPRGKPAELFRWWEDHQRSGARGSLWRATLHSSDVWWNRFHEIHPEYFALQSDGTRNPPADPRYVKLCVSNPAVAEQWLDDAEKLLRENPDLVVLSMMPTDGGGWCTCENCKAWDHPDAPDGVMTERYVKFWNLLARGLKERFPDRDVYLDQMAYATYKAPPIETELEDNIAIRYVGHFPLGNEAGRQEDKANMKGWAAADPKAMGYRPNLFWYDGGFWGMPAVEPAKTIEDFRFLADVNSDYLGVDSVLMHFATQGPQLYLMAQLAYDPLQDGGRLLDDYYRRAFGPAAEDVRQYFELMADAHTQLVETEGWRASSGDRRKVVAMVERVYTPELLARAQALLDRAEASTANTSGKHAERVAFVQTGLDFLKLQRQIIPLMARARSSAGQDREAVQKAIALSAERDELLKSAPPFAFDASFILDQAIHGSLGMQDYLGPPSEELRDAEVPELMKFKNLAVADRWQLVFSDDFERETLGDDWEVLAGQWSIEDGELVSSTVGTDSMLIATRRFPTLQRIEFKATAIPAGASGSGAASAGAVSDVSAFIHAGPEGLKNGYFLQFGGGYNRQNALYRQGNRLIDRPEPHIIPGQEHTVVAEFDGQHVRLKVDGEVVLEYQEDYPLVGADHDRVGLYFYTPVKVSSVKVYTAEPRERERWDDPDME